MKTSFSACIAGLLALLPGRSEADGPLELSYCPTFNENTGGWNYTFELAKTGAYYLHGQASHIIFGNNGINAPPDAEQLQNFVATSVSHPYSEVEETEVNRFETVHKGPTLVDKDALWMPRFHGILSWEGTADNYISENLYWSFLEGTFPQKGEYILATLKSDCPDPPTAAPTPAPTPRPTSVPSAIPSSEPTAPTSTPSLAPTVWNVVRLFYCYRKINDHEYVYAFSLKQIMEGYDDDSIGEIVIGDYSSSGSLGRLINFEPTSDAPRPYTNFGDSSSGGFTLSPPLTLWNPHGVGDSLSWTGSAANPVVEHEFFWRFHRGTFPGKGERIEAVLDCMQTPDMTPPPPG